MDRFNKEINSYQFTRFLKFGLFPPLGYILRCYFSINYRRIMKQKSFKHYRKLVCILKKNCPLAYPVSVKRVPINNLDGDCSLDSKKFFIRINKQMPESAAMDTLLHEWAHARAWNHLHDKLSWEEFEKMSHDASWGVAYSEVYRIYESYFFSQADEKDKSKCSKFRLK